MKRREHADHWMSLRKALNYDHDDGKRDDDDERTTSTVHEDNDDDDDDDNNDEETKLGTPRAKYSLSHRTKNTREQWRARSNENPSSSLETNSSRAIRNGAMKRERLV